ncbi:hypothetical protein ACEQPO_17625 [Bacillus sp. SL00103]
MPVWSSNNENHTIRFYGDAYAFFAIFALYDPVWFTLIKVDWVVFTLLILMSLTYGHDFKERVTLWVMSICLGEALYAPIHRLTSSIVIGDLSFLSLVVQGVHLY